MNQQRDLQIDGALRRVRDGIEVPPVDPGREQALLARFDEHWARPRRSGGSRAWALATAASIAIAIALDWLVVMHAPRPKQAMADPGQDAAEFVRWPGADGLPPFESGGLVQVAVPVSALPALGLWPPPAAAAVVQAEIVVGQDGFARAVRLVR